MSKSEKNLVEAVNRLAAKMDSYDQRFTSLGSDISKIQSQVDLLMHSIQVLQEE
jgi:prefoldin subunit 5